MASPSFFTDYSVVCCFQSVPLYRCITVSAVSHVAPSFFHGLCFRVLGYPRVAFLALEAGVVLPRRAVSENSCIRGRCLFGEDSIAYDRSFV